MDKRTWTSPPKEASQWLHLVIVGALSAYLVIGVVVWGWLLLAGRSAPDGFTTVLSTIAGGLIGILAPIGGRADEPPADRG